MTPCFLLFLGNCYNGNIVNKFNNMLQNYVNFDKMIYITERSAQ